MKKFLLSLIIPALVLWLTGCEDDSDIKPVDLNLLNGAWEVADQGSQKVFDKECLLDIAVSPDMTNGAYGGYQGTVTTFRSASDGTPIHDKAYSLSVREMEDRQPLLTLVLQGELDSDDLWEGNCFYKITKLTDTCMWWQVNTNADNTTIKFRRRTDLQSE